MSRFLRKTTLCVVLNCFSTRYLGQRTSNVSLTSLRRFSISSEDSLKHSFTVSYLMNSLGFSKNNALLTSKHVSFDSSEKVDQTIEVFKGHGFSLRHIADIVRLFPKVLSLDPDKIILPKLEFLRAKGLSGPEMVSILSRNPSFFQTSLAKKIVPSYYFFRGVFGSDSKTALAVKRSPDILVYSLEKLVSPNIECLCRNGVTVSNIFRLVVIYPRVLARCPAEFKKAVEEAAGMGFDVSKTKFVKATAAILLGMRESRWKSRVEAYKQWGWSDEEILKAFKSEPTFMCHSLDRIMASMEFFVAEMGVKPSKLATWPTVLSYSLKRARLRCSVYRDLLSKDLLKGNDISVMTLVSCTENKFLGMYVTPYVKEYPELLDLYNGKTMESKAKTMA